MKDREGNPISDKEIVAKTQEIRDIRNQYFPNSFIYEGKELKITK